MRGSTKSKIILVTIVILLISVLIKLLTPLLFKGFFTAKVQSFIKHNYKTTVQVRIKKVNLKIIDLLLLKPTLLLNGLRIGDNAIFETIEAELNLLELVVKNNLIFESLNADYAEILVPTNFKIDGFRGKESKQIFIKKANFQNIDLLLVHPDLPKKKFEFRSLNLSFNDFAFPDNSDSEKTFFKLDAKLKNYRADGSLNFKGNVSNISGEEKNVFEANGEIIDLDLQQLLTVMDGKKHALDGNISSTNFNFIADSKNQRLNADLKIKSGNTFLMTSMKKAQSKASPKFNLAALIDKSARLAVSIPDSQYYKVGASNSNPGQVNAKFEVINQEFYLKEIKVSTPFEAKSSQKNNITEKSKKKKSSFFKKLKSIF